MTLAVVPDDADLAAELQEAIEGALTGGTPPGNWAQARVVQKGDGELEPEQVQHWERDQQAGLHTEIESSLVAAILDKLGSSTPPSAA